MFGSGGEIELIITVDTLIGNLWTFLGSLSSKQDVTVIVDGADAGDMQITADWAGGSTFQLTAINGGRFIGLGGNAGDGGDDLGADGTAGSHGTGGGAAVAAQFDVDLDIDDGFLLGGGGGGGGGSYKDNGATGTPGGGGGGGVGFGTSDGGDKGSSIGTPIAIDGGDGSSGGNGAGGNGGEGVSNAGGNGGVWGAGGTTGRSTSMVTVSGGLSLHGGIGGRGGQAFSQQGGVPTFNGVKSEATLRSESRIKGDTESPAVNLGNFAQMFTSQAASSTSGWRFDNNGNLVKIESVGGNTTFTNTWTSSTSGGIGANYEIRQRALSGDNIGSWDTNPGTIGDWFSLGSNRQWSFTVANPNFTRAASLIEIRRNDLPAGSSDDETTDSIIIVAIDETNV